MRHAQSLGDGQRRRAGRVRYRDDDVHRLGLCIDRSLGIEIPDLDAAPSPDIHDLVGGSIFTRVEDEIEGELQDNYQNIQLRLRYRRNVWRDWLYVEVWPIVGVAEERDWDTVLGAFFRLEITFGGKGKSRLSD